MSKPVYYIKYGDDENPLHALEEARKVHGKGRLILVPDRLWKLLVPKHAQGDVSEDEQPARPCQLGIFCDHET
jgi:hypothetical protein